MVSQMKFTWKTDQICQSLPSLTMTNQRLIRLMVDMLYLKTMSIVQHFNIYSITIGKQILLRLRAVISVRIIIHIMQIM